MQSFLIFLRTLISWVVSWLDRKITPNSNVSNLSHQPTAILVRHGETESNSLIHTSSGQNLSRHQMEQVIRAFDTPLTPFGVRQAQATAEHLVQSLNAMGAKRVAVWVSPFERAIETARPFLLHPNRPPCEMLRTPLLQEQVKSDKVIPKRLREDGVTHFEWPEYLERVNTLKGQIQNELNRLGADEHLVIFGHSLTFSLLLSAMVGSDKIVHQLPNCSISSARMGKFKGPGGGNPLLGKYGWEVLQTASVAHLPRWLTSGIHTLVGSS